MHRLSGPGEVIVSDTPRSELPEDLAASGWKLAPDGRAITRSFHFRHFRDAVSWMMRAAFEAEELDHHPEWTNVWNRVDVRLTTHDAGGLTERDFLLARRLDALAREG